VVKIKLSNDFAKQALAPRQFKNKAIKGSDALDQPAFQAEIWSPPRPQTWEAGKLLQQIRQHEQNLAANIACALETLVNGRNTRPGLDFTAIPDSLLPFAVALLHKAGACSAYAQPQYQQQLPLNSWLSAGQYQHLVSNYGGLCYSFQPTYWNTAVEAVPGAYPLFKPGSLAKALLSTPAASLLKHCCLPGMPSLAAAAEQMGLAPVGTAAAAAAAKAAASASSGMGMLQRIWCRQLMRLRPHVMLGLLAACPPMQMWPATPVLVSSECSGVAASSGQGGGGAGSAPTAVGADEEGSKAAEPAAVLPPSRREQGGSRQRIGRQLQHLGRLVGRVLLRV
jgi:hypothetical protein